MSKFDQNYQGDSTNCGIYVINMCKQFRTGTVFKSNSFDPVKEQLVLCDEILKASDYVNGTCVICNQYRG